MENKQGSSVWKRIVLHVIVPAGLTILLFLGALFCVLLPAVKANFLQQKRQLIKELTENVYALVEHYDQRYHMGELTLEQAQERVLERIRAMRYGPEKKDYFWVHDLRPVMIMHPYRRDLENQDISGLEDSRGKFLILEMNKKVTASPEHAGYVDYMWQWKDDPLTDVPKLSYVCLYEPWEWVIGSGIYLEDIQAELATMTRRMEKSVIVIFLIVTGISGYLIWQGVCAEVKRRDDEQQREALMKSLAIKNEELESVVYIASHDLRSPLINLQGFSSELEQGCKWLTETLAEPDSPEKQARISSILTEQIPECLGFIKTNAEKMKGLVNGLLQLSRLGVAVTHAETLDMNELLKKVKDACHYQLTSLDTQLEIETLPSCRSDAKLVDQIFTNLIDNAMKYRHPDRTPHIHVTGCRVDGTVEYVVRDNGVGIDPAHLAKIFEMFHQIHPGSKSEGVGLGLTIVRRILDMLGGDIRVDSDVDTGTTFTVVLPAGI